MGIEFTSNKKVNYWINKIITSLYTDFYEWLHYAGRMIYNAFILYFFFIFIKAFFLFVWKTNELTSSQIGTLNTLLFAVAVLSLILKVFNDNPLSKQKREEA